MNNFINYWKWIGKCISKQVLIKILSLSNLRNKWKHAKKMMHNKHQTLYHFEPTLNYFGNHIKDMGKEIRTLTSMVVNNKNDHIIVNQSKI